MKKILAIICVLALVLAFAGCGTAKDDTSSSQTSTSSIKKAIVVDEDDSSSEATASKPVLTGDDEYVVVGRQGDAKLTSVNDLKGKKVGFIFESDSQLVAEYYAGTALGYNTDHDAYSGMLDKSALDYIIVSKSGAESRTGDGTDFIVVLDKIVIE